MAQVTRRIGLSLGADLCWPLCYEALMKRLDLAIPVGGDTVRFEVERVTIEPFDLRQPCRYDLVVDRLTHWYMVSREWIKKAVIMDGLYVFNNPWAIQSMEKHTTYAAMMKLGLPVPETWLLPPKAYEPKGDLAITLKRYARLFDLGEVGEQLGYPMFMKPYDGGGWTGVSRIPDEHTLRTAYEHSGTNVMHLQRAVEPHDLFVRCIGFGPQTRLVRYDPSAPLHDRYTMDRDVLPTEEESVMRDMTLTINAFFGWDFNSCEALRRDGVWHPIDFANACPDSQVTSLHYHFPWLVKANLKWSIFCAATKRRMRQNLDWQPFWDAAAPDLPYRERLRATAAVAEKHFDARRFEVFCARHLAHLDEVVWEFFATDEAREAVRLKVEALFPAHEVAEYTELFWSRIQRWRDEEATTVGAAASPAAQGEGTEDPEVKRTTRWHSDRLGQEVQVVRWGTFGKPVLLFPTAGGDAEEVERFHMLDAVESLLAAGRVKVYSCDSVAGQWLIEGRGTPEQRCLVQNRFQEFVYHELVPAIRADCNDPAIEVIATGASIGAFHALAVLCRFPDAFSHAVAMSGTYDIARFVKGPTTGDLDAATAVKFVPTMNGETLDRLRTRLAIIASGEGRAENMGESWNAAHVLGSRGVPNRVDPWGKEWHHDWVTWRRMLPQYLDELTR